MDKLDKMYSGVVSLDQHAYIPTIVRFNIINDNFANQQSLDSIDDFLVDATNVGSKEILTSSIS